MASLYIVSTPIGNRKDITLRALEVLSEVEIILCEDTRKTGQLLKFYEETENKQFKAKLISYYEEVEERKIPEVIEFLKQNKQVALVSNSGTPLISDPGFKLVRECIKEKIKVISIPGVSAILAGLIASGLPTNNFTFLGFLPKKQGKKEKQIDKVKQMQEILPQTVVFYESPFRILKTLKLLEEKIPEAEIVLARELTKKFEEVMRGTVKELISKLENKKIKGEIVVLLGS